MNMGNVHIQVTDSAGDLLPCRLHIKQTNGDCWMPPDVLDPRYTDTDAPALLLPGHYNRYLHLCHGVDLQSMHLNTGSAAIPVPAGAVQVFLRAAMSLFLSPISSRSRRTKRFTGIMFYTVRSTCRHGVGTGGICRHCSFAITKKSNKIRINCLYTYS